MSSKMLRALQVLMWCVCAVHLTLGIGLNLVPGFTDAAARIYGVEVEQWSPQFLYILKPLGAFTLALGVAAIAAARDPVRYRAVVYAFATLFVVRAAQRIWWSQEVIDNFGIPAGRNAANAFFFLALAASLIVLDRLVAKETPAQAVAGEASS